MRSVYEEHVAHASEIERQIRRGTDKIVGRKFGPVAKVLWPFKTAAHLATVGAVSQRQAERILAGEFEPNAAMVAAVIVEMTRVC
jgi:hypothetical protein